MHDLYLLHLFYLQQKTFVTMLHVTNEHLIMYYGIVSMRTEPAIMLSSFLLHHFNNNILNLLTQKNQWNNAVSTR